MPLSLVILVASILLSSGCARVLVLHPLGDRDIYINQMTGDVCFSEYYLDTVLKVKIDKSKGR